MANVPPNLPMGVWLPSKIWKMMLPFMCRDDGSCNRGLIDFIERKAPASITPIDGICSKDVTIDKDTDSWVRIFYPAEHQDSKIPVLFYIHGGFFVFLSPSARPCDSLCRGLAKNSNAIVVSINYRRIPEHRYPTQIEDCYRGLKWVINEHQHHLPQNADLSKCFIVGDSAGGNLAHFLGVKAASEDLSPLIIRGLILMQPSISGDEKTPAEVRFADAPCADKRMSDWRWKAYLPVGATKDHPACNLLGPHSQDISQVPIAPLLVIIGGYCPQQDWHHKYVEGMKKLGKKVEVRFYDEAIHGFYMFAGYHYTSKLHADVHEFVQAHCADEEDDARR